MLTPVKRVGQQSKRRKNSEVKTGLLLTLPFTSCRTLNRLIFLSFSSISKMGIKDTYLALLFQEALLRHIHERMQYSATHTHTYIFIYLFNLFFRMFCDVYNQKSHSEQDRTLGRLIGKQSRLGWNFKEGPQEGKEGMGAPVPGRTRWAARRDAGPGRNETLYRFSEDRYAQV